jgi:hypothetical protein
MAKNMTTPKRKPNRKCYACCADGTTPYLVSADDEHFVFQGTDFRDAMEYALGIDAEDVITIRRISVEDWDKFVKSVVK